MTLFEKYGPSPRLVIDLLRFPDREAMYLHYVNIAADDLSYEFSKKFYKLKSLDSSSNISAEILTVKPNNPQLRLPDLCIPTPFLAIQQPQNTLSSRFSTAILLFVTLQDGSSKIVPTSASLAQIISHLMSILAERQSRTKFLLPIR